MASMIQWIKSNLIVMASLAVIVVSLGFLIVVPQLQGKGAFREALQKQEKADTKLRSFMNNTVPLPAENPDDLPKQIRPVTINQDVLTKLKGMYDGFEKEFKTVRDQAIEVNLAGHEEMLEGLLPTPGEGMPYLARTAYLESFRDMFDPYDPNDTLRPRLNAGMPPTQEELQMAIDQVREDFMGMGTAALTDSETKKLAGEMRGKLIDLLHRRAEQIHIYADRGIDPSLNQADFPFHVDSWAFMDRPPAPHQLWEGQLELWIQQDIVRAIAEANHVDDPKTNVLTSPVKRLIRMQVVPGYVGLHTQGAALTGQFSNPQRTDGAYPPPIGQQRTNNVEKRQSDNFYIGPSGRVSNALYDVRHAVLDVVVDYQRLPQFINAINTTNFMTVLNLQIEDIDEYDALREGFMYGEADSVHATLVIESIWLRGWTEPKMPSRVRSYVGIDEPEEDVGPGRGMPMGAPGIGAMPRDFRTPQPPRP